MLESTSFARTRVPFSFELYPARDPEGEAAVHRAAVALGAANPSFISVTFGADGSAATTDRSLALVRRVHGAAATPALAHLTSIGTTVAQTRERAHAFLDLGVRRFLALRGGERFPGETCAVGGTPGLIRLLREVHAERGGRDELQIAVAAFPHSEPHSEGRRRDIRSLLEKQDAGADVALTQLFFAADDYLRFTDEARAAGVSIPIVPGVMPITDLARVPRARTLAGGREPHEIVALLEDAGEDPAARRAAGVACTARLVRRVVDAGAPAVHLYASQAHTAALDTLRAAGLVDGDAGQAPVVPAADRAGRPAFVRQRVSVPA